MLIEVQCLYCIYLTTYFEFCWMYIPYYANSKIWLNVMLCYLNKSTFSFVLDLVRKKQILQMVNNAM
jgi:hypothetical protein